MDEESFLSVSSRQLPELWLWSLCACMKTLWHQYVVLIRVQMGLGSPRPGSAHQSAVVWPDSKRTMTSPSAWLKSAVGEWASKSTPSVHITPEYGLNLLCCCLAAVRVPLVSTWSPMRMWCAIADPLPIRLLSNRLGPRVDVALRHIWVAAFTLSSAGGHFLGLWGLKEKTGSSPLLCSTGLSPPYWQTVGCR